MAKITKVQSKAHDEAEALLSLDRALTHDEVQFCFDNWTPMAQHNVGKNAVFFTPNDLAQELALQSGDGRVIDLCAGIGILSFWQYFHEPHNKIVAVEINQEFVDVGRRLVPQAEWIRGNAFDLELLRSLGKFDYALCNPPFGQIATKGVGDWLTFQGPADLMMVEVALRLAENGATFILPQMSVPWRDSGTPHHEESTPSRRLKKFMTLFPNAEFGSASIDCSLYDWQEVSPVVELVRLESGGAIGLPEERK